MMTLFVPEAQIILRITDTPLVDTYAIPPSFEKFMKPVTFQRRIMTVERGGARFEWVRVLDRKMRKLQNSKCSRFESSGK